MLIVALRDRIEISRLAFAAAVAVLAAHPVAWLVGTWLDPAFDSHGYAYFALVALLAGWSAASPLTRAATPGSNRRAMLLLAGTAAVRLAGQVLAIDTIGALAL